MKLYEIKEMYENILEEAFAEAEENEGVIPDELSTALDEISETLEAKIVNCGLMYKNFLAEAEAIKSEKLKLEARQRTANKKAEWLKKYLGDNVLPGMKINYPQIAIGWRKSQEVYIADESRVPDDLCKIERTPRKTDIKKLIKAGESVDFAEIVDKNNIQIK